MEALISFLLTNQELVMSLVSVGLYFLGQRLGVKKLRYLAILDGVQKAAVFVKALSDPDGASFADKGLNAAHIARNAHLTESRVDEIIGLLLDEKDGAKLDDPAYLKKVAKELV